MPLNNREPGPGGLTDALARPPEVQQLAMKPPALCLQRGENQGKAKNAGLQAECGGRPGGAEVEATETEGDLTTTGLLRGVSCYRAKPGAALGLHPPACPPLFFLRDA